MADREQIAWAAGLFEGEGSMSIRPGTAVARLDLGMTDEDAVRRFHEIVGAGKVRLKKRDHRPGHRDIYCWHLSRSADIRRILVAFLPWFCERRTDKALEVLAVLERNLGPRGEWALCPKGHELSWDDSGQRRRCRVCHNERMRDVNRRWRLRQIGQKERLF